MENEDDVMLEQIQDVTNDMRRTLVKLRKLSAGLNGDRHVETRALIEAAEKFTRSSLRIYLYVKRSYMNDLESLEPGK